MSDCIQLFTYIPQENKANQTMSNLIYTYNIYVCPILPWLLVECLLAASEDFVRAG